MLLSILRMFCLLLVVSCTTGVYQPKIEQIDFTAIALAQQTSYLKNANLNTKNIALLLPLSGKTEKIGKNMLQAAEIALVLNKDANIKLFIYDTESPSFDPNKIIGVCKEKDIKIILGPVFYSEAKTVSNLASKENITLISYSNNRKLLENNAILFSITPELYAKTAISYFKNNAHNLIALLPVNTYGISLGNYLKNHLPESHIIYYDEKQKSSIENKLDLLTQSLNPAQKNLIYIGSNDGIAGPLSATLAKVNKSTVEILANGDMQKEGVDRLVRYNLVLIENEISQNKLFKENYKKLFHDNPSNMASLAYYSLDIISQMIRNDIDYTRQNIIENSYVRIDPNGALDINLQVVKP